MKTAKDIDVCKTCRGSGKVKGQICFACRGTGKSADYQTKTQTGIRKATDAK